VYHVRGEHAHAWPEIYLDGFGWVAFEPTPGRGAPNAEQYTGIPEQQADPNDAQSATTSTTLAETPVPGQGATPSSIQLPNDLESTAGELPDLESKPSPWPGRLLTGLVVLAAGAVLWAIAVPLAKLIRRRRRRAAAEGSTSARIEVAWAEASEALTTVGVQPRPAETPTEYALRAAAMTRVDRSTLLDLAAALGESSYAPDEAAGDRAETAEAASAEIVDVVRSGLDRWRRLRIALDPRPLLPRRRTRMLTLTRTDERRPERV
jgi:hypothetical protein